MLLFRYFPSQDQLVHAALTVQFQQGEVFYIFIPFGNKTTDGKEENRG